MTSGAIATPEGVTYGRCRVCRRLGTAYGVAAGSRPTASARCPAGRFAPPLHSLPPVASENAERSCHGVGSCSVFRSPLDKSARGHRRVDRSSRTYPHRPQVLLLLGYDHGFPAFGRMDPTPDGTTERTTGSRHRRATPAPCTGPLVRSPREPFTPAPTRQSSCRRTRQNNCRCTPTNKPTTETAMIPFATVTVTHVTLNGQPLSRQLTLLPQAAKTVLRMLGIDESVYRTPPLRKFQPGTTQTSGM